jgi:hypothetical protein
MVVRDDRPWLDGTSGCPAAPVARILPHRFGMHVSTALPFREDLST